MMKVESVLIVLMVMLAFNTQSQSTMSNTYIVWTEDLKLAWSDFEGYPRGEELEIGAEAITASSISIKFNIVSDTFCYNVRCLFLKNESWTITNSISALIHEQGHFDIAEVEARRVRCFLSSISYWHPAINDSISQAIDSLDIEGGHLQNAYDDETEFGSNAEAQKKWNKKIGFLLAKYKMYNAPNGKIPIR